MVATGSWAPSACFFCIAVAYTIGWTAVSSELTYYTSLYGPEILLLLNVAYFVPSVPIMVLQTLTDTAFDRAFGVASATAYRFVIGLGGATLVCATLPFHAQKASVLLGAVALLGIFCGVAFGSSYQLVSRFSARESVALTTGFVGSGPVVLLLDAILRIGAQPQQWQRVALFEAVAAVIVCGMLAGLHLLSRSWRDLADYDRLETDDSPDSRTVDSREQQQPRGQRRGSDGGGGRSVRRHTMGRQTSFGTTLYAEHTSLVARQHAQSQSPAQHSPLTAVLVHDGNEAAPLRPAAGVALETVTSGGLADEAQPGPQPSAWRMLRIWPAAVSLALSSFTSVLLFPFFTYVEMTTVFGVMQPSALFAARVIFDIVGRLAPKARWVQTEAGLLVWSLIRLAITPLFFLYIGNRLPWASAELAVAYVAVFWFTSGYINTCAFILAPQLVPPALASKAGGAMALTFQIASLLALVMAWLIQLLMRRG